MELHTMEGQELVKDLVKIGYKVFLDLKFSDIPNTVAAACEVAADIGVWMINVHATGGSKMMKEVMKRLNKREERPLVIAVTILTHMDQQDIEEIGLNGTIKENVLRLATLAKKCGLDGVVSSAEEVPLLKKELGKGFICISPAIRFLEDSNDDQNRVMTPGKAIQNGSDYLVIGRSIINAKVPLVALQRANSEVSSVGG